MNSIRRKYREIMKYELYGNKKLSVISKIKIQYIAPSSNFIYLIRKMQMYHEMGGRGYHILSRILYIKIYKKYGCCIFPDAVIGKGLTVFHPVGIVIGRCVIGNDCTILQGVTIGEKNFGEFNEKNVYPRIGNNVTISANSTILGGINITDKVVIGANSLVIHDLLIEGTYVGIPTHKV